MVAILLKCHRNGDEEGNEEEEREEGEYSLTPAKPKILLTTHKGQRTTLGVASQDLSTLF